MKANTIAISAFMAAVIGNDADARNIPTLREMTAAHDSFVYDFPHDGTSDEEFVEFYDECFADDFEFGDC